MNGDMEVLQEIFDRSKVEEKQELVGMLEKYGNQVIHKYSEQKGWEDGSTEKALLHGAFGALMGDMAGGNAATGALAGGVNEYVMGYLTKTKGEEWVQKNPDAVQWISAGVGTAVGFLSDENMAEAGIALSGTKWNYYGSRRDKDGKILGMGKVAALLQPDGSYQYVTTNEDGEDVSVNKEELYPYTSVWVEDPVNPGMGYTLL